MPKAEPAPTGHAAIIPYLLALPAEQRARAVAQLGPEERESLDRDFKSWHHRGQLPPELAANGLPWRVWVLMAGRGFGKTLAGAQWITAAIAAAAAPGAEPLRIALVGATLEDARRVMVEGRSGLLEVADAWVRDWEPSLRRLTFRTGAEATLFSGASPDLLRGPEHHLAWCDELAKWEKARECWDMLQLGLRLGDPATGQQPRALITTTPRPGALLAEIMAAPDTVTTRGATRANPHLPEGWQRSIHAQYAGTRLGRQELEGELLTDAPGALWTPELLERCRASSRAQVRDCGAIASQREEFASAGQPATRSGDRTDVTDSLRDGHPNPAQSTTLRRTVIAVDPPSGDGTCGIIVCARSGEGEQAIAHILADHSVTARSPEGWASAVAHAARIHSSPVIASPGGARQPKTTEGQSRTAQEEEAGLLCSTRNDGEGPTPDPHHDRIWTMCPHTGHYVLKTPRPTSPPLIPSVSRGPLIVAEKNQGGRMVQSILRTADPALRVKAVTATVGKAERAAPVAMLFEAGKVILHGHFPELEAELLGMIAGGDYEGPGTSPDRADAMVWGLTELMLTPERAPPRVRVP